MDAFDRGVGVSYYFSVDKDAAVAAFIDAGGSVDPGTIDLNERIMKIFNQHLFSLIWKQN